MSETPMLGVSVACDYVFSYGIFDTEVWRTQAAVLALTIHFTFALSSCKHILFNPVFLDILHEAYRLVN